jgi:hypothetical protein
MTTAPTRIIALGNCLMPMPALKPVSDQDRGNANGERHGANQLSFHHSPYTSRQSALAPRYGAVQTAFKRPSVRQTVLRLCRLPSPPSAPGWRQ